MVGLNIDAMGGRRGFISEKKMKQSMKYKGNKDFDWLMLMFHKHQDLMSYGFKILILNSIVLVLNFVYNFISPTLN